MFAEKGVACPPSAWGRDHALSFIDLPFPFSLRTFSCMRVAAMTSRDAANVI